jgi:hypothetical protein
MSIKFHICGILRRTFLIRAINSCHPQGITSFFMGCVFAALPSLYATLVCVACSQLEKIRAALLNIRQKNVPAEQDCGTQADEQEREEQAHASQEMFRHMQEQLNECIRQHQKIRRCGDK